MREVLIKLRPLACLLMAGVLVLGVAACGGGGGGGGEEAAAPAADAGGEGGGEAAGGGEMAYDEANLEMGNPSAADLREGSATITGTVTYEGAVPTLPPIQMAADPACQAKHDGPVYSDVLVLGDGNTMGNIWIHVKSGLPEKDWGVPSKPAVMDQNGCQYMPHVIGVMQGQDLVFLNQDNLLHNVHGQPAANREFNLGMPPTRAVAEAPKLTTPEPMFSIKCDVHPWMQSYASVVTDPYFEVTEADGQFTLDRLPPGTYEIEAWHERLGTQTQTVTVGDGETVSADFVFTRPSA